MFSPSCFTLIKFSVIVIFFLFIWPPIPCSACYWKQHGFSRVSFLLACTRWLNGSPLYCTSHFLLVPLPRSGFVLFFFLPFPMHLPKSILNLPYFSYYAILAVYINISLHSKRSKHLHLSFLSHIISLYFNTDWYLHALWIYIQKKKISGQ